MAKRYQRGNQEGIDQRRTDNTMTKRYQSGNQEVTNQRRTDHTLVKENSLLLSVADRVKPFEFFLNNFSTLIL
jgi:hypothetical protein